RPTTRGRRKRLTRCVTIAEHALRTCELRVHRRAQRRRADRSRLASGRRSPGDQRRTPTTHAAVERCAPPIVPSDGTIIDERRTTKVVGFRHACMTRDVIILDGAMRREEKSSVPWIAATIPPFRVFTRCGLVLEECLFRKTSGRDRESFLSR